MGEISSNLVSGNLVGHILSGAEDAGWGEKTALCEGTQTLSYSELGNRVRHAAGVLTDLGISPNDSVAIFSPDCIDAAIAILAVVYAGAIAIPVSDLSAANDLRNRLIDANAKIVLVHESLYAIADQIRAEVASLKECLVLGGTEPDTFASLVAKAKPMQKAFAVETNAPAFLLYSAAVSTKPDSYGLRGVAHSHGTPLLAFDSFAKGFLGLTKEDRVFSTVRLSTAYGLSTGLIYPLLAGSQCLMLPKQPRSETVFKALRDFKPSIFAATPSLYGQMARDAVNSPQGKPLKDVRFCIAGAESVPPKVIAMVRGVLGSNVTVGYGLTEAFHFVIAGPAEGRRQGYCGQQLEGVEIRVVDDNGKEVGVDEIGTLEISGPTVIQNYWGSTETISKEGWFRTQDRFLRDENNGYFHCGREDSLFKVSGQWVSPEEVEGILITHEAVWECAVIGADDEDGLIKPLAFVVPNLGHSPSDTLEDELREYVKAELAPFKYPRWIEFVDSLPKGSSGVILRFKLLDKLKNTKRRLVEMGSNK